MPIAIKVDEDLPGDIAVRLRATGYDAISVHEQSWTGRSDEELWRGVQAEHRCLMTADKGFADARLHPPGSHEGIVLFRLARESRGGYLQLLEFLLEHIDLSTARGAILVVSPDAIRVHR